jgi:DNA-binding MarR family transcriptional regulator
VSVVSPVHPSQLSRIGPLLRQAQRHSARTFVAALQPLGIEGRHYGVLYHLDLLGPLSQRRLMDLTGEDKSSMVRTVDDLERLGLAVRRADPHDRRAHAVELTNAGRQVRARAAAIGERVAGKMLAAFTPEERDVLLDLLERFVVNSSGSGGDLTASPQPEPRVMRAAGRAKSVLLQKGVGR